MSPGVSLSTMNWVRPPWRSSDVRKSASMWVAVAAAVVQIFVPFTRQPPGTSTARVRSEARSEPAPGSLIPITNESSPRAMPGRNSRFCSSVPLAAMLGPDWRSATQWYATGAPRASSSSTTMRRSTAERPPPPYSLGSAIPIQPRAPSSRENSGSTAPGIPRPTSYDPAGSRSSRKVAHLVTEAFLIGRQNSRIKSHSELHVWVAPAPPSSRALRERRWCAVRSTAPGGSGRLVSPRSWPSAG